MTAYGSKLHHPNKCNPVKITGCLKLEEVRPVSIPESEAARQVCLEVSGQRRQDGRVEGLLVGDIISGQGLLLGVGGVEELLLALLGLLGLGGLEVGVGELGQVQLWQRDLCLVA